MADKLDTMDLKQIITLHLDGLSNRKIGASLDISRNTVNTYTKRFKASEYSFEELLSFDNTALTDLFTSHTTIDIERQDVLMRYFEYHYLEYSETADNPYSYTQFMEHYRRKYAKVKGSMKLEHEAGKEMFIDFAGKHLHIVDKQTGELVPVEVFVAILPNSHYTYVEAIESQKKEDLIGCWLCQCIAFLWRRS